MGLLDRDYTKEKIKEIEKGPRADFRWLYYFLVVIVIALFVYLLIK